MSIMITSGAATNVVRMVTLKYALKMEMQGLKKHGESAYSIIKRKHNLTGNKASILKQYIPIVEKAKEEVCHVNI